MVIRSSRDCPSVLPRSSSKSQSHSERNQKKVRRNVDSFVAHRCDSSLDNRQIGGHLPSLHGRWSEECASAGNLSCLLYSTRLVRKSKSCDGNVSIVNGVWYVKWGWRFRTYPWPLLLSLASHDDLFFFQLLFAVTCVMQRFIRNVPLLCRSITFPKANSSVFPIEKDDMVGKIVDENRPARSLDPLFNWSMTCRISSCPRRRRVRQVVISSDNNPYRERWSIWERLASRIEIDSLREVI